MQSIDSIETYAYEINESLVPKKEIPDHPYRILIVRGFGSGKNKCII